MKRLIYISIIVFSTLLLLIPTLMPHHHHDGRPCFVLEFCDQDGACNDEHTHHHNTCEENSEDCILESKYVISFVHNEIKPKVQYIKDNLHGDFYLIPICFFIASYLNYDVKIPSLVVAYGECLNSFKSVLIGAYHGLRAPPSLLSYSNISSLRNF